MKNTLLLVLVSVFLLGVSCKKKADSDANNEDDEQVVFEAKENEGSDEVKFERVKDCDDFIDQYEEWSEDYVAFMSKYKDNPVKAVTSPEYQEMLQNASTWSQQWLTISVSCAQNSKYEERVNEITDKMDKKMKELGF